MYCLFSLIVCFFVVSVNYSYASFRSTICITCHLLIYSYIKSEMDAMEVSTSTYPNQWSVKNRWWWPRVLGLLVMCIGGLIWCKAKKLVSYSWASSPSLSSNHRDPILHPPPPIPRYAKRVYLLQDDEENTRDDVLDMDRPYVHNCTFGFFFFWILSTDPVWWITKRRRLGQLLHANPWMNGFPM